jgi:mRNA-degrading endonuclease RelE of RelBE toxin-antitoxin system
MQGESEGSNESASGKCIRQSICRRIRIGNLRVLYSYQAKAHVIDVDYLDPRGEIYKGLGRQGLNRCR